MHKNFIGSLIGLAIGDALGTTLEFTKIGFFNPINDILGGGPFRLKKGQWTDDTSMALCLSESLIEKQGFDATDQMNRYLKWYKYGYLSSTGTCFDIGNATRKALENFKIDKNPYSGDTSPNSAGNGSLMRICPIPMYFSNDINKAIFFAEKSSQTTHGAKNCIDACKYTSSIIYGLLNGETKEKVLSPFYHPTSSDYWDDLSLEIQSIASGSFKDKHPPEIRGTGYVVQSLEASLWAFYNSSSFEEGALLAVNLGEDADTTGAIYGQIAGAYYGIDGIPEHWKKVLSQYKMIENLAICLYQKK